MSSFRLRPTKTAMLCALAIPALMAMAPVSAKTLVYCSEGSPENFYPGINTTGTSFDANSQIYSRIVDFERGGTAVTPGLAEKWTISKDGLEYTFFLRKGVKWHSNKNFKPSREFNADDFMFAIERQWKENDPYFKVTSSNHSYFNDQGMAKLLKSVDKVDEYTVKITLNKPEAPFLSGLAMEYAGIQSKEYAIAMLKAGTPEKIDQEPIGTGPFMLVQYQKDAIIRYKAFPEYWRGKAKIDDLIFSITPDAAVRWAKLQKGECHVMPYPNPAEAKKLLAAAGFPNGFTTDLWAMPVQRPYNPNAKRIAELMQADLAKVGVKAEIKTYEWGEYRKRMQAGEHQMGMLGWTGDNGDPDNFLNTLLGCEAAKTNGSNVAKFCYQPFEEVVQKAKTLSSTAERTKLYEKAQVIFKEQAPWFTIAHAVQIAPVRKEVLDYRLSPFAKHTFYGVDMK